MQDLSRALAGILFCACSVVASTATADIAPSVSSSDPGDGALNVPEDANIFIGFSEPVNVFGSWFEIVGDQSGIHTAEISGGPTGFTLNPDTDFIAQELVTVTIFASDVSDLDADDPPDNMGADFRFTFTPGTATVPEPATLVLLSIALAGLGFNRRKRAVK